MTTATAVVALVAVAVAVTAVVATTNDGNQPENTAIPLLHSTAHPHIHRHPFTV